ncbi:MAG: hypothetical protein ABIG28_03425 [archaeon]
MISEAPVVKKLGYYVVNLKSKGGLLNVSPRQRVSMSLPGPFRTNRILVCTEEPNAVTFYGCASDRRDVYHHIALDESSLQVFFRGGEAYVTAGATKKELKDSAGVDVARSALEEAGLI